MAIDVNSLTINNITPEIMSQMSKEEIEAFKAKITPEQMQALADKMGGSGTPAPEMSEEEIKALKSNSPITNATDNTENISNVTMEKPTEQKGSITFGRK